MGHALQLRELRAERQRSERGELRVALVLGEPGMGKTRLAAELLPTQDEPALGLAARSSPLRRLPPLRRWIAALGRHVGVATDGLCPTHDRVVEGVPDLLAKVSVDRPIVVVLDDVHWGGQALWKLLLLLSQDHPAARLLVLATARPGELASHRVAAEALRILEQEEVLRRVQLRPLAREDIGELAAATVQQDTVPAALTDWLMVRSRGNPRFAVGLLEALVEEGADLHAPRLRGVPEGLARWIRAEVTRLAPCTAALLELLAAMAGPVDPDDLARIAGQPIEEVAGALERLVRCGMVIEREHDRSLTYEVADPLVQQVLYACVGGARRRIWHRRAAVTLLGSGRAEVAASHFARAAQAGDDQAIHALIEAVAQAEQAGSHATMWTIVPTLLDLLPSGDKRCLDVADVLSRQPGVALAYPVERYASVGILALRRMQQLLAAAGDVPRRASVGMRLAGFLAYGQGEVDAGAHECRQILALCRQAGCEHEARMAAIELAKLRGWAGDLPGQARAARQVASEADQAGDQRTAAMARAAMGLALGMQGCFIEAEDALLRSIDLAPAAAQPSLEAQSLAMLAAFDACQGRMVSARTRWARAAASSPQHDALTRHSGAYIALLAGDLATVQTHVRQTAAHDAQAPPPAPSWTGALAAMAAAEGGRITQARRELDRARQRLGRDLFTPLCCWAEGVLAWAEGRLAAATALLQRAINRCRAMSAWMLMAFIPADLAEFAWAAGDAGTVAWAAAQAEDLVHRIGAPSCHALQQLTAAWALLGRDRHDQAARAALGAADGLGRCGHALLAARARIAYASAARRGDRSAAADALRDGIAGFDACGAVLRRDHAHKLLTQLESGGSDIRLAADAVSGPASLTERERQVAELAARGYTARRIADQLHISVRTVETHLARIYAKLGAACKQDLVHRAAELGLPPGP